MIPVAFINLDRRKDRRGSVESQLSSQQVDRIYRYVAKDAQTYPFTQDELNVFKAADFINQRVAKPIMCNFLSHYDLWDFMIENRIDRMIILQDDVILKSNFYAYVNSLRLYTPDDAEVIWLGIPEQVTPATLYKIHSQAYALTEETPYVSRLHPYVNPCSLAYLLTLEGARQLKERAQTFGVDCALDKWMNKYLLQKNIFYVSREIVATSDPSFGSDIF
jgi:GR25 family glycosyltransferase involved in LPS biosynthesis